MSSTIRLHSVMERSTVNGPGERFVIWTQGCPFHCDGCFNRKTHDFAGGTEVDVEDLAKHINSVVGIRGITLSGGEPLTQYQPISELLDYVDKKLDILLFSGYTLDEIMADANRKKLLYKIDASLLGRYNKALSHPFEGKKLVLHQNRIKKEELIPWLKTEMVIDGNMVQITGLYK